jgi:hypothetical protein
MSDDFRIFVEDFADFLNDLEASIAKMRMQIEKLEGSRVWTWNPDKIAWDQGAREQRRV